ncbi:MAG: hypothetical protein OCD02_05380 [Spirochaetaceae bacterium]
MKKVIVAILFILTGISTLTAGTNGNNSWYGVVNVGTGGIIQKGGDDDLISRDDADVSHSTLMVDVGLYGVVSHGTLFGLNANFANDINTFEDTEDLIYHHTLLALSGIHYFDGETGTGFFVRADVGASLLSYEIFSDTENVSDWGFGVLVGGGFAINLGEVSVTINGNYAYRGIDHNGDTNLANANYDANVFTFALGLLY